MKQKVYLAKKTQTDVPDNYMIKCKKYYLEKQLLSFSGRQRSGGLNSNLTRKDNRFVEDSRINRMFKPLQDKVLLGDIDK